VFSILTVFALEVNGLHEIRLYNNIANLSKMALLTRLDFTGAIKAY